MKDYDEEPRDDEDNPFDADVPPSAPGEGGKATSVEPEINRRGGHQDVDREVHAVEENDAQTADEPRDAEDNQFDADVPPSAPGEGGKATSVEPEEAECRDANSQAHGNGRDTAQLVVKASADKEKSNDHEVPPLASDEGGKVTSVELKTNRQGGEHQDADREVHAVEEDDAQTADEPRDDEDNQFDVGALPSTSCGTPGDQSGSFTDDESGKKKQSSKKCPDDANGKESIVGGAVSYRVDAEDIDDAGDETLSFLRPVCIGIAALVIVWIIRQFLPLIQAIAESSGGLRVIYLIMLLLPVGVLAYAIWAAARIFMRLPPGVNCDVADCVDEDGRFSEDKLKQLRERLIKKYLPGFCRGDHLERVFGKKKSVEVMRKVERLCLGSEEGECIQKTDDWFKAYNEFQNELKQRAEKIRDKYANAIALFTITSPKSQLDIIGTLFFSTRMLLGIARIFNKRMTRLGAFRLTVSWAVHIYAIGEMQAIGGKVGGVLGKTIGMFIGLLTKVSIGDTIGKVLDRAISLGIEGGVNKKLARLLGDKAIAEFVAVKGLEKRFK